MVIFDFIAIFYFFHPIISKGSINIKHKVLLIMPITAIHVYQSHADCFRGNACWKSALSVRETRMGVVGVGGSPWVFDWFGMGVRQPLWVFRHPQLNTILHLCLLVSRCEPPLKWPHWSFIRRLTIVKSKTHLDNIGRDNWNAWSLKLHDNDENNGVGDVWRCKHDKKNMKNSKIGRSLPWSLALGSSSFQTVTYQNIENSQFTY